ncbi:MAG: tetratricopeptide repeat protein [Acidobacteria bacterium]|nr:tetratricopeptide repeat protein [Acidobacteriota bacterium]
MKYEKSYVKLLISSCIFTVVLLASCQKGNFNRALEDATEYMLIDDHENAEMRLNDAISIARGKNDEVGESIALGYIGRLYSAQNRFEEAEKAFTKRIQLCAENLSRSIYFGGCNEQMLGSCYLDLIVLYSVHGSCEKAEEAYSKTEAVRGGFDLTTIEAIGAIFDGYCRTEKDK